MTKKILLVDDEDNVLRGYLRSLRNAFDLEVAQSGREALQIMKDRGPFAVLVSDMRMPGLSGLDLITMARSWHPDTIRIMLTGDPDQKTAVDAVNHGQVFRFLAKPCPPDELSLALHAGLRQHELVVAERELLEQTLTGAITLFSELLAGVDPVLFSRCQVVRERSAGLARQLGYEKVWAVEIAALMGPVGRITLPAGAVEAAAGRAGLESLLAAVPEIGARLIQPIPRMEEIAGMIRYQAKGFDGTGMPADDIHGEAIPLGARILKVAWDFTELEHARKSRSVAFEEMKLHPRAYDPAVIEALGALLDSSRPAPAPRDLRIRALRAGMTLARDIRTGDKKLVLPAGLRLGPGHLELLSSLAQLMDLLEPVSVVETDEVRP